jgi:CubicO group peptidase (beta-lactamase class C family)
MRAGLDQVFPAAALLVARNGSAVLHRAYGYLDPETRRRPVDRESLFDLASLTKLFTVTAFMTLVDRCIVTLHTSVAEVLTEFNGVRPIGSTEDPISKTTVPVDPAFANREVDARRVTFWHLLTHTSGLAAWRSLYRENGDEGNNVPRPHHVSRAARVRRVGAIHERYGFAYPPGQRVVYSDLGIILLGEAVSRLSGIGLEAYVNQAVFEPLRLTHTMYNPLAKSIPVESIVPTEFCAWRRRRCIGEVHDENAASLAGVAGHAGLFSTARDVATLGQMYLNDGLYGGRRVLSRELVTEMTRVQVDSDDNPRGLGWLQRSRGWSSSGQLFGPHSYGHTGFTGTSLWVDPDRNLLVALLTNRVYYGRDPAGIADFRPRLHDAVVSALRE